MVFIVCSWEVRWQDPSAKSIKRLSSETALTIQTNAGLTRSQMLKVIDDQRAERCEHGSISELARKVCHAEQKIVFVFHTTTVWAVPDVVVNSATAPAAALKEAVEKEGGGEPAKFVTIGLDWGSDSFVASSKSGGDNQVIRVCPT